MLTTMINIDKKRMLSLLPDLIALAACLLITAVVLRDVPNFYFVSDTWGDLNAVNVSSPLRYFVHDTYGGKLGRHYRPLWRVSGWIQHLLSGEEVFSARVYFFFQLLWHGLIGMNVYLICRLLRVPIVGAALAMLLMMLHPATPEVVAWVAAESYLLAGLFSSLAVVLLLASQRFWPGGRNGVLVKGASLAAAACAALSNEQGLGVFPLLALLHWGSATEDGPPRRWESLRSLPLAFWWYLAGLAILLGIYFSIRFILFGAVSNWDPAASPGQVRPIHEWNEFAKVFAAYLLWQAWPPWLDNKIILIDPAIYLLMLVAALGFLLKFGVWKGEQWAIFFLGAFATYAPMISAQRLYVYDRDPVHNVIAGGRIVYLAVIFVAVALGLAYRSAAQAGVAWRRVAGGALLILAAQQMAVVATNYHMWEVASARTRRFVETLPQIFKATPPRPVYVTGLEPFVRRQVVEDVYTNTAYLHLVASQAMIDYAMRDSDIVVTYAKNPDEIPAESIILSADRNGTVVPYQQKQQ